MGYRIIADLLNFAVTSLPDHTTVEIADPQWQGYQQTSRPPYGKTIRYLLPLTLDSPHFLNAMAAQLTPSHGSILRKRMLYVSQPPIQSMSIIVSASSVTYYRRRRRLTKQTRPTLANIVSIPCQLQRLRARFFRDRSLGRAHPPVRTSISTLRAKFTGGGSGGDEVFARKDADEVISCYHAAV